MGRIKQLKDTNLVGETSNNTNIYPITAIKAVFNTSGQSLESILDTINSSIEESGNKEIKTVNFTDIDTLDETKTGIYYLLGQYETNCGILLVTGDYQNHTVNQFLISNFILDESGQVDGRHSDSISTILTRRKVSLGGDWSKWNCYFINDSVASEYNTYSAKKINDELTKLYRVAEFAGTIDDELFTSSTPGEGNKTNVYFSTYLKCFVIKKGSSYHSRWDNSSLWNDKNETSSPSAYTNCLYISNGIIYKFNGNNLEAIVSSGGSLSIEITQSTGNSTSKVMSQDAVTRELENKQNTLISGNSIKTVNGQSILGSGNIEISGGSSTSGDIKTIELSALDTLGSIENCGYYLVVTESHNCGTLIVTSDDMAHGVMQFLFSNYQIDDSGNIGGQHTDGTFTIVCRYKKLAGTWSRWNYFGLNDNVVTKFTTYSSEKINNTIYTKEELENRIIGKIILTNEINDYSELDTYDDPSTQMGKWALIWQERLVGYLNIYLTWGSTIIQELESFMTNTDNVTSIRAVTRYVRSKSLSGNWSEWVPYQNTFIGDNNVEFDEDSTVPSMKMFKELSNRIDESGGIVVDSALSTSSINPVQNKVITAEINRLLAAVFPLRVTVSGGGLFEKGISKNITVSWTVKEGDTTVNADSITVNEVPVTGTSKVYNNVTTTTTYTVKVTKNGNSAQGSTTATFIAPMYFGFASASQVGSLSITSLNKQSIKSTPVGSYSLNNSTDGYYLWLCIPNSMTINKVTSSGFDIPMEAYQSGNTSIDSYKCYRSSNSINSGEININIL